MHTDQVVALQRSRDKEKKKPPTCSLGATQSSSHKSPTPCRSLAAAAQVLETNIQPRTDTTHSTKTNEPPGRGSMTRTHEQVQESSRYSSGPKARGVPVQPTADAPLSSFPAPLSAGMFLPSPCSLGNAGQDPLVPERRGNPEG